MMITIITTITSPYIRKWKKRYKINAFNLHGMVQTNWMQTVMIMMQSDNNNQDEKIIHCIRVDCEMHDRM